MDYAIWLFVAAVATAQESPPPETEADGGLPLAIPISDAPPPPQPPPAERPPDPGDAARARAIRTYRDQSLALRTFGETQVGTTWSYVPYGRWGPYGYRTGWRAWPRPYVVHTTARGVFQGPKQLDVPATLGALGDESARTDLERRIQTNRTIGTVSYGLGVGGVAASVVGLIALDACCSSPVVPGDTQTLREAYTWSTVTVGGLALMVGGFVGGTFPSGRAQRLQYDYTATLDLDSLEQRIVRHNEQLATELGLSATEAARLDTRPRRKRGERP